MCSHLPLLSKAVEETGEFRLQFGVICREGGRGGVVTSQYPIITHDVLPPLAGRGQWCSELPRQRRASQGKLEEHVPRTQQESPTRPTETSTGLTCTIPKTGN